MLSPRTHTSKAEGAGKASAREALLVGTTIDLSGAELRAAATVAQGIVAVGLAAIYGLMADRLTRRRLINSVNGACAACLAFIGLWPHGILPGNAGDLVAYIVTGATAVVIIAQFWAFATDLEGRRAGRMLPVLSLAASAGGVSGALAAGLLVAHSTNAPPLLFLGAAVMLCLAAVMAAAADRHRDPAHGSQARSAEAVGASARTGELLPGHKYVLGTAVVTLLAQWVGTNGENLLFGYVQSQMNAEAVGAAAHETMAFYASFSLWSNLAALLLQVTVVYGSARGRSGRNLLLVLPVVTLASATAMVFLPALGLVKCLKVAENATRYSINNTAAQLLWLPTTPAMKYKAKIVVETVVVRLADGLAAVTAFIGVRWLHAPLQDLYLFNAVLVVVWAITAAALVRAQGRRLQKAKVFPLLTRTPIAPQLSYDIAA